MVGRRHGARPGRRTRDRPCRCWLAVAAVLVAFLASPALAAGPVDTGDAGGTRPDHSDRWNPADDHRESVSERFESLLAETGALGAYVDDQGTVVVVVPASGSSRFSSNMAAELGLEVQLETRPVEPSDVVEIKRLVKGVRWTPEPGNAEPVAFFHARLGKVKIFSDAPQSLFADVLGQYWDHVEYAGRALTATSRSEDYEPHWGGAWMDTQGTNAMYICSSGFGVTTNTGNPRMLTAAHCFTLGQEVHSTYGSSFGVVTRRDNYPTNDFELVGGSGIGQGGSIYVGGSVGVQERVSGAGDTGWSTEYCFSGATSFENCGLFMVDSTEDINYTQDGVTTNVQIFEGAGGDGACGGDSGAPFYRYGLDGRVQARGIVVAGEDWPTRYTCTTYAKTVVIEKWAKISNAYDVTIRTSSW